MDYSNNNEYESWTPNNDKDESEDEDTGELDNSQHLNNLMSNKIDDYEDPVILTKESYNSTNVSVNGSTNINTPVFTVSIQTTIFIFTVCMKPWLLFCVYVVSTKTRLMLYTYYYWYKYLYKCLYVKIFYIISTNASLRLWSYWYFYVHLYSMNYYDHLYSCL